MALLKMNNREYAMKRIYYLLLAIVAILPLSCGKQDAVYKEFVKPGGYVYPAKPLNLTAISGYQRIFLEWEAPMDPSIRTTKLFWDNYTDSLTFSISDYDGGMLSTTVDHLDDRTYTFDVVNYDAEGHRSLATEITTTPFGESWLLSHSERSVRFARMSGDDALITMSKSTDEMVATRFRYRNNAGETIISDYLKPEDLEMTLPDAKRGKRFEFQSAYLPADGRDTVWAAWTRSMDPILFPLPTEGWEVSVTTGQVFSTFTPDKVFDGIIATNNRWHAARTGAPAKAFPKVLCVDTKVEGDGGYAFSSFVFCLSPSGKTYRYIREIQLYMADSPFDPDESDYAAKYGDPVYSATLNQNEDQQQLALRSSKHARYFAVVFLNSWNANGYIDLWELIPYGYIPSEVE